MRKGSLALDLSVRGLFVFVAALLVNVSADEFIVLLRRIEFWQEAAAAALTAVVSQLLALGAHRLEATQQHACTSQQDAGPGPGVRTPPGPQ